MISLAVAQCEQIRSVSTSCGGLHGALAAFVIGLTTVTVSHATVLYRSAQAAEPYGNASRVNQFRRPLDCPARPREHRKDFRATVTDIPPWRPQGLADLDHRGGSEATRARRRSDRSVARSGHLVRYSLTAVGGGGGMPTAHS
jgi:hypothetical protein